ncbi:MAG: SH3 domain-containing protein [Chloroflexota bacterium]
MKKLGLLLLIFCSALLVSAQEKSNPVLQVVSDSAFLRVLPDEHAEPAGSVFANDSLLAVGRNMDGEWLEVRRTGFKKSGGWIARKLTAFTFSVSQLPITDSTTGLLGIEPVMDSGYAILMINEGTLRNAPSRYANKIVVVPLNLTLPVLERTPDNQWLKINYRGYLGWVAEYTTRATVALDTIPLSPEFASNPDYAAHEVISPEMQLAQIDRLVSYLTPINKVAAGVLDYWRLMARGDTMECLPPAGNYTDYSIGPRDLIELPELRRQTRLLKQAIADINAAINTMKKCGVYTPPEIQAAYANTISAQHTFVLILQRMNLLRKEIAG